MVAGARPTHQPIRDLETTQGGVVKEFQRQCLLVHKKDVKVDVVPLPLDYTCSSKEIHTQKHVRNHTSKTLNATHR